MNWPGRILGVVTLLIAAAYLFVGFASVFGAVKMADEGGEWNALLSLLAEMIAVVGVGIVLLGAALMLAGGGLLGGKRWGWWLAIPLSLPVAGIGWFFVGGPDPGAGAIAPGVIQLCYPGAVLIARVLKK